MQNLLFPDHAASLNMLNVGYPKTPRDSCGPHRFPQHAAPEGFRIGTDRDSTETAREWASVVQKSPGHEPKEGQKQEAARSYWD